MAWMPAGVQGSGPFSCSTSLPRLTGCRPSASFAGAIRSSACVEVEAGRHRMLDQVGVDRGVGVEAIDRGEQRGLAGAGGDLLIERRHADQSAGLVLLAHVARARGIVADQDGAEPGHHALRGERGDAPAHVLEDGVGDGLAFEQICRHRVLVLTLALER